MKVILLKDIRKVGKRFEVKTVADGYALNFLIPQKLAEVSTVSSLKKIENLKSRDEVERKIQEDLLVKNLKSLEGVALTIQSEANDKGHLFKGIHKDEIVEALKKQTELDILADHIILEKPIKEVGEHTIEVSVQDKKASFKLTIEAK